MAGSSGEGPRGGWEMGDLLGVGEVGGLGELGCSGKGGGGGGG